MTWPNIARIMRCGSNAAMEPAEPVLAESRVKRWRLPGPLTIFIVAVVLFVVGLVMRFAIPLYRHRVAVREVQRLTDSVQIKSGGPVWLRKYVGHQWMTVFDDVDMVAFNVGPATEADLAHLKHLTNLRVVFLSGADMTDAGMVNLEAVTSLKRLTLNSARITNAGLVHLKGMKNLEQLRLHDSKVTDAGIADLMRALPGVRVWH